MWHKPQILSIFSINFAVHVAYQYTIWISCLPNNRLRVDIPYLLCCLSIPLYKHIKIWGARVYIINGRVTRNNLDKYNYRLFI